MTALLKYLTVSESELVEEARERHDDLLVHKLISIIERLQEEVDHRAWLRPSRDVDDPDVFILAASNLYPPEEAAEHADSTVTFDERNDRLRNRVDGVREFFETSISVPVNNSEVATISMEPRTQPYPNEEDESPPHDFDPKRQNVSIRVTFEDGCPTLRASIHTGDFGSFASAGFTAEMHKSEIKLHINGFTEVISLSSKTEAAEADPSQ